MAVQNTLTQKTTSVSTGNSIASFLASEAVKKNITNVVGKQSDRFIASVVSAVQNTPALAECTSKSILSAALLGQALNLSPSPQLGQFYLVPYNDKEKGKVAQFQLGYKGYIQLAIRSGQYKKLNVVSIKEGELIKYNPLEEELEVRLIEDEEERENAETIGYYAFFEYTNGFKKAIYWSKKKMEAHALKYSAGYRNDKNKGTAYTFWAKDFDGMAYKTLLRQLISKWGIMSIDLVTAMDADMAVINDDGTRDYVDNVENIIEVPDASAQDTPVQDTQTTEVVQEQDNVASALFN